MSDLREVAQKLGTAATDALIAELPELGSRMWQVEEVIQRALLDKLRAMAEERRRQDQVARFQRIKRKKGGRR